MAIQHCMPHRHNKFTANALSRAENLSVAITLATTTKFLVEMYLDFVKDTRTR
jgi:hypothetical protein